MGNTFFNIYSLFYKAPGEKKSEHCIACKVGVGVLGLIATGVLFGKALSQRKKYQVVNTFVVAYGLAAFVSFSASCLAFKIASDQKELNKKFKEHISFEELKQEN